MPQVLFYDPSTLIGYALHTAPDDALPPGDPAEPYVETPANLDGPPHAWAFDPATAGVVPAVVPVTEADLTAELERRLAAGFDFDFGDARGVHRIGTAPDDMARWNGEVNPAAQALINLGMPGTQIGIKTETGPVAVTAMEWQQILAAAMQFRQPIFQAYFALKAMDPTPQDYAEDSRWGVA